MEVNIKQAQKMFFSKSSFEMIYFEAFANALDAGATDFKIEINLPSEDSTLNMTLDISDNGVGFDDIRFSKFGKLFDVEERTHKGLGRLVYLCYFDKVHVESYYDQIKHRTFDFDENFKNISVVDDVEKHDSGTSFHFTSFNGEKLWKNSFVDPASIKDSILKNYYMLFYKAKQEGKPINVTIKKVTDGVANEQTITEKDIPEFKVKPLDSKLNLFDNMVLYYNIKEVKNGRPSVITALAVDNRTMKVDIIADENIQSKYEMIFLLMSDSFKGNVDESRSNLTIPEVNLNVVKNIFRNAIAETIKTEIPQVDKENKTRVNYLKQRFPHLDGYFDVDDIGYASQLSVLKNAQDKFFKDQREILCATELTDEQFEKSLNLSARSLAEYILFRQNVIGKMKKFTGENKESEIHNLIAPQNSEFKKEELSKDLYRNNVWVLDDKFMSYCTVLSEAEMSKVISVITEGEVKDNDDDRPDITLFFSADPNDEKKMVDVVVVELKRLGIKAEQNSIVEFQLDTRTQRLAEYYGQRIQRMWFYGIVDFDEKYILHLINDKFNPLYSNGKVYFRSKPIYTDLTMSYSVIQNAYIMDYKALIEDANSRNETFLKILQNQFKEADEAD